MKRSRSIPRTAAGGLHAAIALGDDVIADAVLPVVAASLGSLAQAPPTRTTTASATNERALTGILCDRVTEVSRKEMFGTCLTAVPGERTNLVDHWPERGIRARPQREHAARPPLR